MFTIRKHATECYGTEEDLSFLKNRFSSQHYVLLPKVIDRTLIRFLMSRIGAGSFEKKTHAIGATELTLRDPLVVSMMGTFINAPEVLGLVKAITARTDLRSFQGRIYRMLPETHWDEWHDDLTEWRRVGLSINLSTSAYRGGELEMRSTRDGFHRTIPNLGIGDALLFELHPRLEHRVRSVQGDVPKTAYAGWFRAERPHPPAWRRK